MINSFQDPEEALRNPDLEVGLAVGLPLLLLFSISVLICVRCHYKKRNEEAPAPKVVTDEVWSARDRRMTSNMNMQSSLDDNYDDMSAPSAPRAATMESRTDDARKAEEGNYFCEANDTAVYIEQ